MTLGTRIRAARLGFRWSAKHGAWVRIVGGNWQAIRVDVAPEEDIPSEKIKGRHIEPYRVWWEDPGILDGIRLLKHVTRVRKPFSFIIDDSGELVRCIR